MAVISDYSFPTSLTLSFAICINPEAGVFTILSSTWHMSQGSPKDAGLGMDGTKMSWYFVPPSLKRFSWDCAKNIPPA